jgi:hypothetical protein
MVPKQSVVPSCHYHGGFTYQFKVAGYFFFNRTAERTEHDEADRTHADGDHNRAVSSDIPQYHPEARD